MKINALSIRNGNILEMKGGLWIVIKYHIMQPGKGASVMQVEMRNLKTGLKTNERFRTQETVDKVRLDEDSYQFLYLEGDMAHLMHLKTYEQIEIATEMIGDPAAFLQDGMEVTVLSYEGEPLTVEIPDTVTLEVIEADAVIKGQTASSSYKPSIVEGDIKVMVPPHITVGTRIVVDTRDSSYIERAKD